MSLTKTVAEISRGDHACVVMDSDEQHWEVVAGYVHNGLALREKVVFFDGDRSAVPVLRRLAEDRMDVDTMVRTGQLTIVPPDAMAWMWTASTEEIGDLVAATVDDALAEGYPGVRLTNEPAAGRSDRSVGRLGEIDRAVDAVLRARPATLLCQYERRHWAGTDLIRLGELHQVDVVAPALYDDGLLRVTRLAPFRTRVAGEIDFSNRELVRMMIEKELDQALRAPSPSGQVEVHLESLRFADVTSAVQFVQMAGEFPQSQQLVLHGVQPGVRRLLDRCGAAFSGQLVLREGAHR
ncbi:MAG: MEDS domain-containing protein [Pseudonocardia sp.]